ncbi:ejaculatory bulb-specific protein 3-like [Chrysoperla carnea]|uniref:Chemosensory protein 13 n=1 Tax=Chrysoperla nipponensis TaxID=413239 RepID=A0A0R8P2R8_CHRNP|nr:ejaculatory bulb-specific protein 3-like [Chrysoperla carnea]AKW47215.1 chemosensory protein 13 [Chrysoperla nipponensis]
MKFTLLVAVFLFVAIAHSVYGAPEPANSKYTTKYDNINLDEILNSSRLLDNYCKCLLDLGRCTPEGKELKKNLIDALQTGCSKCSEKQRKETPRVLKHLREHKNADCFKPLTAKYDPKDEYKNKFEKELEKNL